MIGSSSSKMQRNFCKESVKSAAADAETTTATPSETLIKCTKFPFLGQHSLHTTDCTSPCNNAGLEQIPIGYFYELNHQNLPRRSPIHLKSIRVVMVTEKTDYNVTVKFPSSSSLKTYFRRVFRNEKKQDMNQTVSISPPKLDEEFVMGSKPAKEVLARQILPSEFSNRKKLESFWSVEEEPPKEEYSNEPNSSSTSSPPMDDKMAATGGTCDGNSVKGSSGLYDALTRSGLMRWGVRRRVAFVGRHTDLKIDSNPEPGVDGGQSSLMDPVIKSEDEAEDEEAIEEGNLELESNSNRMSTRKRTREISMNSIKKAKAIKQNEKVIKGELSRRKHKKKKVISAGASSIKKKISGEASIKKKIKIDGVQGNEKLSYDRWSKQRYKTAEGRMLDILKETNAVFGKPILRRELRVEARKHIGDTGLLDHLLKHMAGKVAPNGVDRFRRRHNSEGEMEYWLESADLVNVRKEAGVIDPYWTPPPGWKLGDNPSQHPVCAKEFQLLKDEMADLKRNMEGLLVLKSGMSCLTKEATVAESLEGQVNMIQQQPVLALMSSSSNNLSPTQAAVGVVAPLKGMYDSLVKKKAQLEQQLVDISVSLSQMQKDVGKITSTVVVEDTPKSSVLVESSAAERTEATAGKEEEGKEKRRGSSLVVLKREGDDQVLTEDDREKVMMNEAQKAAKRQRIRSGFRICKPQGTFLWPNMVGGGGTTPGSTSTAAAAGAGCCNNILALSPHEHGDGSIGVGDGHRHDHQQYQHPQVMVQVQEDLNMVPTPSSVNSSSSASHCLQLLTTTREGGPRSPLMKPLAERRAVTVTVVVPDLNDDAIAYEDGDNNQNNISTTTTTTTTTSYLHHGHHGHGPHGYLHHGKANTNNNIINSRKEFYGTTTPTSSLSAHQAFVLPPSHQQQQQQEQEQEQQEWGRRGETQLVQSEATTAVPARRSTELVQYHRKQHQHQQQLQQHIDMGLGMGIYGQDYMNGPV